MPTLDDIRKQVPDLQGLDDQQALDVIHDVYYPQMDKAALGAKLGVKAPPKPAESPTAAVARGFKDAMQQVPETIGGTLGLVGDAIGADGLRDYGMGIYDKNAKAIEARANPNDSFTQVLENGGEGAGTFLAHGAGYVAGQAAQALVTGGAGGFLGSQLAKRGIREVVARGAESAMAKEVAGKVAAQGAKAGAGAALFGSNLVQEAGSIYPEAVQEAQKDERNGQLSGTDLARVGLSAAAAAGVETAMDARMFHRISSGGRKVTLDPATGEYVQEGIGKALRREIPGGAAKEAVTEGIQTGIERVGAQQDMSTADAIRDYVDSMALGGLGGGLGGAAGALHSQKGPMERAATAGLDQKIALLTHDPQPFISFPDGSVGTKADFEQYIASFPPEQQLAERRRILGRDPDTGKRIEPEPKPEPTSADNDKNMQATIKAWSERHDPVTLDYAKALIDAPGAKGMELMIVPHGSGKGYTVLPSKWLTLDAQARYAALQKGDEAKLPGPDKEVPGGAIRVDSTGQAAPETYGEKARSTAAQRAIDEEAAAKKQKEIELGKQYEPGKSYPGVDRGLVLNSAGKPFMIKVAAINAQRKLGDAYEVIRHEGGFAVQKKPLEQPKPAAPAQVMQPDMFEQAAHEAATSPQNDLREPTQAQKLAGNYRKGHVTVHGLDISIENPAGSVRKGVDRNGKAWENTLEHHYGYIRGTVGADKDHIDAFIHGTGDSDRVFIVNQIHPDNGKFDEHKVIFGAQTADEARQIYQANYAKGWQGGKDVQETDVAGFKAWLKEGDHKKPFAPQADLYTPRKDGKEAGTAAPENLPANPEAAPADDSTGRKIRATTMDEAKAATRAYFDHYLADHPNAERPMTGTDGVNTFSFDSHGAPFTKDGEVYVNGPVGDLKFKYAGLWKAAKAGKNGTEAGKTATETGESASLQSKTANSDANMQIPATDLQKILKKQIPAMSDEELLAAHAATPDDIPRKAKLAKAIAHRKLQPQTANLQNDVPRKDGNSAPQEANPDDDLNAPQWAGQDDVVTKGKQDHAGWRKIGKNSDGDTVYEAGGIRRVAVAGSDYVVTEKAHKPAGQRYAEFKTVDETKAAKASSLSTDAANVSKKTDIGDTSATKPQAPGNRIEDFGEKIAGARKDLWADFRHRMTEDLPADAKDITLSKYFPQPDYEGMIAEGADIRVLAALKALRDEIPTKPKMAHKLRRWGEDVKTLRGLAINLITGAHPIDKVLSEMRKPGTRLSGFADRIELYAALGYPAFKQASGYRIEDGSYSIFNGQRYSPPITKYGLSKDGRNLGYFDSRHDATEALRQRLAVEPEGTGNSVKLDIYSITRTGEIIIGKKVASGKFIDLKGGFANAREARAYLQEHEAQLLQELERKKEVRPERRSVNDPRVGKDYRMGADIPPEKFAATFGFRGVQFGNYVEQKRRAQDLNNAYDALLDLADILGIPERAVSLNGSLGLAFGARGTGGVSPAAAHYERINVVINLTKGNGAGSLGHEWWHALDNYFGRMRGEPQNFVTDNPRVKKKYGEGRTLVDDDSIRPEVLQAFDAVVKAIKSSEMVDRSKALDETRSKDYWSTTIEMTARAFERYIIDKAAERGVSNDYLANIVSEEAYGKNYPYPTKAESRTINAAFDKLFSTLEAKETDHGVMLGNVASIFYPDASQADAFRKEVDATMASLRSVVKPLTIGDTPAVLKVLGAPAVRMTISRDVIRKATNGVKHQVSLDAIKSLPEQLADPVMVFDSKTEKNSLVVLTELNDQDGAPVVAAIHLNRVMGNNIVVNDIRSVYGKEQAVGISGWVRQGLLRYQHTQKGPAWFTDRGLQLPRAQNQRGPDTKILTEADIVNAAGKQGGDALGNAMLNDLSNDTDRKYFEQVAAGRSIAEILADIAKNSDNPLHREMAQRFIDLGVLPPIEVGTLSDQKFEVQNREKMEFVAGYSPKLDKVLLFSARALERNIVHELTHAATYQTLRKGGLAARQMKALYEHVKSTGAMEAGLYGMENVDEFVAEAFSNPDFRDKLANVTAMPSGSMFKNAWQKFVAIVRRILGLPASMESALDQALRLGAELMNEEGKPGAPNEVRTQSGATQPVPTFSRDELGAGLDSIVRRLKNDADNPSDDNGPLLGNIAGDVNSILGKLGVQERIRNNVSDLFASQKTFNSWWHKTIGTQYHKAQIDADFRRVYDAAQDYLSSVSSLANDAADLAPHLLPKLEGLADLTKKAVAKADAAAVGNAVFTGTLTDNKVYTDAELRSKFKLTDDHVKLYREFRAAVDKSLDDMAKTDMLRYLGSAGRLFTDRVMAAKDATAAADMLAPMLEKAGSNEAAGVIRDKAARVAQLKQEGYAPLMRFGEHTVYATNSKGEQLFFGMAESGRDAAALARDIRESLKDEHPDLIVTQGILSKEGAKLFSGISPDTIEVFATATGLDKNPLFQDYLKLVVNNRSALKRLIHRKGVAGFSQDTTRVLAQFLTSNARASSKNLHMGEMMQAANDIPKERGDVRDEAIKLVDYIQHPAEEAAKVRAFLFTNFIGGSIASAAVNMTQPVMMTLPYLAQFGGAGNATVRLLAAMKTAATTKTDDIADLELRRALQKGEAEGAVSPQEIHNLQAEAMRNSRGVHWGDKEIISSIAMRKMALVWGGLFGLAEQFNRRATFIAAFQTAKGMSAEQLQAAGVKNAYEFAIKAIAETQGIYNRGNRPNWARGALGATLMTFKQYSIAYIEFLKRLPPRERALALAILVVAAGTNGLPFADDLDDVIDTIGQAMGYNMNIKKTKERMVTAALGRTGAELVLHGFTGAGGLPLDVSMRMGMGNLLPATGLLRQDTQDKGREYAEVLGAAGGFAQKAVDATGKLLAGDPKAALMNVAGTAVANAAKAADMLDTGAYRDGKGRKVIATDVADAITKAIGFQPTDVAREQRALGMVQQDANMAKRVKADISDQWAEALFEKNQEGIVKARRSMQDWNEKNPESRITIDQAAIARRVREMRMTKEERVIKNVPRSMRGAVREELQ